MHLSRLFTAAVVAVALPLTAAPATAVQQSLPFLNVDDPAGDFDNFGDKADMDAAKGLDVLRVRHRVRKDGRLVVVSKHDDLTRANTRVNPDTVPIGGYLTMLAAYVDPTPSNRDDDSYTLSFDRKRKLSITMPFNPGAEVPCPEAAAESRVDLKHDVVRYVVPTSCLGEVKSTRTVAQAISYKVTGRTKDGIEEIELMALDQNDRPAPKLSLR